MAKGKALDGKPYAGNPHVRFDEGEVAPAATPRRGSLLYKKLILTAAACAAIAANALTVTDVTARQRWPWNNLVDVDVTISGSESDAEYRVTLSATCSGADAATECKTLLTEPIVKGDATHRLTWDAGADLPGVRISGLVVTATVEPFAGDSAVYVVFDITKGTTAGSWTRTYTSRGPDLSDDACRTTQLWMRRVPAGTFNMGLDFAGGEKPYDTATYAYFLPKHQVKLTKPYYLGVFELTQAQYNYLTGTWPSYFSNTTYRATRPVESVSFNGFRGSVPDGGDGTKGWYDDGTTVYSGSYLARLRTRTGIATFDLPTEAQWERACRAGRDGVFYSDSINQWNVGSYGRSKTGWDTTGVNRDTAPDVGGTAKVGTYPPNPWGFYDMYGNVAELCGDGNPYPHDISTPAPAAYTELRVDPRCTPELTNYAGARTIRGGRWNQFREHMNNGRRDSVAGSVSGGSEYSCGLRLCFTCE